MLAVGVLGDRGERGVDQLCDGPVGSGRDEPLEGDDADEAVPSTTAMSAAASGGRARTLRSASPARCDRPTRGTSRTASAPTVSRSGVEAATRTAYDALVTDRRAQLPRRASR